MVTSYCKNLTGYYCPEVEKGGLFAPRLRGASRHLVKDRMEGSGMRWNRQRSLIAVLKLRAALLNGDWDEFWIYHMEQEKQRRFGSRYWESMPTEQHLKLAA